MLKEDSKNQVPEPSNLTLWKTYGTHILYVITYLKHFSGTLLALFREFSGLKCNFGPCWHN